MKTHTAIPLTIYEVKMAVDIIEAYRGIADFMALHKTIGDTSSIHQKFKLEYESMLKHKPELLEEENETK